MGFRDDAAPAPARGIGPVTLRPVLVVAQRAVDARRLAATEQDRTTGLAPGSGLGGRQLPNPRRLQEVTVAGPRGLAAMQYPALSPTTAQSEPAVTRLLVRQALPPTPSQYARVGVPRGAAASLSQVLALPRPAQLAVARGSLVARPTPRVCRDAAALDPDGPIPPARQKVWPPTPVQAEA